MVIEEEASAKENDAGISASEVDPSPQQDGNSSEIIEETPPGHPWRRQNLTLQIPTRTVEDPEEDFVRIDMPPTPSSTPKRVNFSPLPSPSLNKISGSPGPSSSKTKSTIKNLLPKLSFKYRNTTSEIRKAATLALGGTSTATREKPSISRTLSLPKLLAPRLKNTSSLPTTPIAHSNPESMHGRNTTDLKGGRQLPIHRSHSVPELNKDGSVSLGSVFRVIPTTPRAMERSVSITSCTSPKDENDGSDDDGEDIAEEEAVCRICLVELGEGADTLKMECSCKGDLALAHQECAVKWFSIKGNKTCDVCKQEVQNLPVTLLRIQNVQAHNLRGTRAQQPEVTQYRVWQDVPILVIVSMLAYFCFLEQLLVGKMGSGAIALSLPFSCILGLLASMTATTMVKRKYVWVYATIQFALVVLSAHLFYSLIHMQAVLSVLLATFTGFGVTMCGNSIIIEALEWRERWLSRSNQQHGTPAVTQPNQPQQTQTNPRQLENEIQGAEAIHGS
ncbi:putative aminoacyltransferase, E1 ubiquitin-activating enzyme [Rosa chinensis]|uniref:Putative aminoacyltransferase, E1 ubiquitin-activating enzyme n=1 Tax=Rosa chinensis TaxID=74649 RepID=A0A2P6RAT1_ROSCH|nr:uncharacterized protein LOC112191996 [Rosa chinensis]PRQ43526.1 putative aminoacyltransferase, E1 ubiquitin-activating enzyme [Rosa chinensis]